MENKSEASAEPTGLESQWGSVENKAPTKE